MTLKVIAYARNGHTDKFGIPRQSREESPILTRIVFEPEYAVEEALRGIEGFSHLWLLWGFSEVESQKSKVESDSWSPTVRPPRLGGNKRMGVFATRSPFRPNPIGLSSVKLIKVVKSQKSKVESQKSKVESQKSKVESSSLELIVSGADVLDGTPIYDIKPYLSFSDSHADAKNGFAEETKNRTLKVVWDGHVLFDGKNYSEHVLPTYCPRINPVLPPCLSEEKWKEICYILSQDPRPAYQDDPEREYRMDYGGYTVTFCVNKQKVIVKKIEKQ